MRYVEVTQGVEGHQSVSRFSNEEREMANLSDICLIDMLNIL